MSARELAFRAAVLEELAARVRGATTEARAALGDLMRGDGIKSVSILAADQEIGTATLTKPKETVTATVADHDALLAWAEDHHPDQVETVRRLRPGFEARVLQHSRVAHQPCFDGVLDVPGVSVRVDVGPRALQMRPADDAAEVIDRLWSEGALDLRGLLALPGGEG